MKSFLKEMIIVLLLILIILLVLGILFYEYMPNSKIVPEKVSEYAMNETVKDELESNLKNESDEIIRTYQLDSTDIANYEKNKEYNKGKVNPFDEYSTGASGNTSTGGNTTDNATNGNTTNDNTTQNPSKDNFLNTAGK